MTLKHSFPGSNTYKGFVGFFDDVFDLDSLERLFILKGGPGVGKSTLMKKVGKLAEAQGDTVEYFHCSSDPASLDGIKINSRIAVIDGTAPHIVDPKFPGAADEIIPLGDGLDHHVLSVARPKIMDITARMKPKFTAAHHMVAAAESVRNAYASELVVDKTGVFKAINSFVEEMMLKKDGPAMRNIYMSAVTPDGVITYVRDTSCLRVWYIEAPWGFDATDILNKLATTAYDRGADVLLCHDPVNPDKLSDIVISSEFLITTSPLLGKNAELHIDITPYFDISEADMGLRLIYNQMLDEATALLYKARDIHDELEVQYIEAMDHSKCDKAFERIAAFVKHD